MNNISLDNFVDYCLTTGPGRVSLVRQLKQGEDERFSDFYRPLRDAIVDMHTKGEDPHDALDQALARRSDPRERRLFPKAIHGYRRFLQTDKMVWFEPPMRDYPLGPIGVRAAPEVGLLIGGRPHAIKLYFRGDELPPERAMLTNQILSSALGATWPGTVFATLDVRRAKLVPYRPKFELMALLRAEATGLSHLWGAL